LMDSPRKPDGPPIRDGKPYSRIAKLAEDVVPFAAISLVLRAQHFSAPNILAHDLDRGLLLVEDFGADFVVEDGKHVQERMEAAVDLLVELHSRALRGEIALERQTHFVPSYDIEALMIELELLLDWYLPHMRRAPTDEQRDVFLRHWHKVLTPVV